MKTKKSFNFGWVIVGVSFLTLGLCYSIWYSFSIFFVAIIKEFNWSRSLTAGSFSIFIIIHSLMGALVGGMVDRFGPKKILIMGSLILATGLILASFIRNWWQFYLFYGVIVAGGIGACGWVPNVALINQWFKEKKGLAMGIISSGIGIGILVLIPTFQFLIREMGWRMTYKIMAIFIPSVVFFMAILFLKKSPNPIPVFIQSLDVTKKSIKESLIIDEDWALKEWTARRALGTKQFWLLGFSLFLTTSINQSIFAHQVAFFVDHGIDALIASYIVGMIGVVSIGGKIFWGILSDRIGREISFTLGMACCIIGAIILILFEFFPNRSITYIFSLFFGLGYAATATLSPLVASDVFEGSSFGSIFGLLNIFIGLGGAAGAWLAGFIYDQFSSYQPVFIILIIFSVIASFNIWLVAPRKIRLVPGKR